MAVGVVLLLVAWNVWITWLNLAICADSTQVQRGFVISQVFSSVGWALIGALIVFYRPANRIGWLSLWIGSGLAFSYFILSYTPCSLAVGETLPPLPALTWLGYSLGALTTLVPLFVLLPMLFPTGHFLSLRWAWAAWVGIGVVTVLGIGLGLQPDFSLDNGYGANFDQLNPLGVEGLPAWWQPGLRNSAISLLLVLCFVSIASLVVRFRRSAGEERQQMKWLTYFLATVVMVQLVAFELVGSLFYPSLFDTVWYELIILVVFVGFPIVIGVAILKHRLYDIDLLLNRTLVYGTLTVLLVALYALIVSALGALFHNENNFVASLLAAGVIAVLFQPARLRLQRLTNRWLFGARDDPAEVLTRMTNQMESADSSATLLTGLVATIATSLKLPYVAVWIGMEAGGAPTAEIGNRPKDVETMPLLHQQETIGRLEVAPRSMGETLAPADRQLLLAVARLVATTARTVQLTDEVQEARVRTVAAREEERRRLRRDLHDSLGPMLASQGLKLAAARQLLHTDPEVAERLLDDVLQQGETTVADVRRLVYALRPPTLDELGLVEAIHEYVDGVSVGSETRFTLYAPERSPEIPAAIEVAAFRILQEALANVLRHARAKTCTVTLMIGSAVELVVEDDGVGLPTESRIGIGLLSMRERAAEVGGSCSIKNAAEGGVIVNVSLPLGNSADNGR
jgi:signal transduction histidine kinase